MHFHRIALSNFAVLLLIVSAAHTTKAQSGTKDQTATQHVDKVMETLYRQGAFEETEAQLLGTLKACGEQCSAPVKARIWMYIGVVRADGPHKPGPAKDAFVNAVKLDPKVKLDRAVASAQAGGLFEKAGGSVGEAKPTQLPPEGTNSAPVIEAQCNTDADCKGDRTCVDRHCAWRAAATKNCEKDTDCPGDAICKSSQCVASGATTAATQVTTTQVTPVTPLTLSSGPTVAVRFHSAKSGASYAIRAVGSDQQCALPCTLNLAPGLRKVKVSGDGDGTEEIVVPNAGGDFEVNSSVIAKQFYWGIGLEAVGAGLIVGGFIAKASAWKCYSSYSSDQVVAECLQSHGKDPNLGYTYTVNGQVADNKKEYYIPLFVAGGAAVVTGGILMLTGYSQLHVKPASRSSASKASSPSFPIPVFSVGLGNGNVSILASGSF
jgi:hypothetical protein